LAHLLKIIPAGVARAIAKVHPKVLSAKPVNRGHHRVELCGIPEDTEMGGDTGNDQMERRNLPSLTGEIIGGPGKL
jgi:hypothetical protein